MISGEVSHMARKKTTRKTVTVKKAAGKSPDGKPIQKKAAPIKSSRNELITLLDQLNGEEINWLITQAKTMVYNQKVDEVNKAAQNLVDSKKRSGPIKSKPKPSPAPEKVDIVQAGGPKNFNILLGNARLFLNLNELKSMVKIAEAADNPGDAAGRLFRWCRKERNDILIDGGIAGPSDSRLRLIFKILKDRYTVG